MVSCTWKHNIDGFCNIVILFFLVFLDRNSVYLTFKYKMSVVFFIFLCYYKYTAKNVDDNMIYL